MQAGRLVELIKAKGIFFDETPSTYSPEVYEYLKIASQAVRNGTSFKDRFVGTSFPPTCIVRHGLLTFHDSPQPRSHSPKASLLPNYLPKFIPQPHRHNRRLRRSVRQMARRINTHPSPKPQDQEIETRRYSPRFTESDEAGVGLCGRAGGGDGRLAVLDGCGGYG
jgi:hypothetical protein